MRRLCGAAFAVLLLAGCMSSPTYGTGKSSSVQLAEDLTGVLSLAAFLDSDTYRRLAT